MTHAPADQAVRDRVVRDFDTTFLLEAGAGTGKTTVLVSRILALVRTGRATLDRIVAITFTEKAAGELKLRLREGIEDALERTKAEDERQRLLAAATDLERAPVSTIHAFAAALLRERPFEAGLDPGFKVAAEIAGERVLDDAWDAWFDQCMAEADPTLLRALTLGLKIADLKKAAVKMAHERDVLGSPQTRPPYSATSLKDRVREAVTTLTALKPRCTHTDDDAYQQIERLEAFLKRADRADGLALEDGPGPVTESTTFAAVADAVRAGRVRVSAHALREADADGLALEQIEAATLGGFDAPSQQAILITVYRPDPQRWSDDFRRRRTRDAGEAE